VPWRVWALSPWGAPRPGLTLEDVIPPAILSQELREARRRDLRFEEALPAALEVALAGEPNRRERGEWQMIFADQIDVWRGAYERRPASRPGLTLYGLLQEA
jgi:hypothetical protein